MAGNCGTIAVRKQRRRGAVEVRAACRGLCTNGAAVGGANVTLTNDATQVKHTATTNKRAVGFSEYQCRGAYTLTVSRDYEKTYTQHNVVLEVGSSLGLNMPLTVGSTTEEVTVSASGLWHSRRRMRRSSRRSMSGR